MKCSSCNNHGFYMYRDEQPEHPLLVPRYICERCRGERFSYLPLIKVMGHHGKWPRRVLNAWQNYQAVALELTFHHSDNIGMTEWDITLPSWPWRWVCWLQGHQPYGHHAPNNDRCVICKKFLERRHP
jgi:hypothetical protein